MGEAKRRRLLTKTIALKNYSPFLIFTREIFPEFALRNVSKDMPIISFKDLEEAIEFKPDFFRICSIKKHRITIATAINFIQFSVIKKQMKSSSICPIYLTGFTPQEIEQVSLIPSALTQECKYDFWQLWQLIEEGDKQPEILKGSGDLSFSANELISIQQILTHKNKTLTNE